MSQHARALSYQVAELIVALASAQARTEENATELIAETKRITNALVGKGKIEDTAAQAVKDINAMLDRKGLSTETREAAFNLRAKLRSLALIAEVDGFLDDHVVVVNVSK